jgi:hypothetical protein
MSGPPRPVSSRLGLLNRKSGGQEVNRTLDTKIFSLPLYRPSYLPIVAGNAWEISTSVARPEAGKPSQHSRQSDSPRGFESRPFRRRAHAGRRSRVASSPLQVDVLSPLNCGCTSSTRTRRPNSTVLLRPMDRHRPAPLRGRLYQPVPSWCCCTSSMYWKPYTASYMWEETDRAESHTLQTGNPSSRRGSR